MVKQPTVVLCHRNYDRVCVLHPIDDLKIYVAANAVDEITFTIHKYNNGVEFEYWDKIKSLNVVYVEDFGYFEVAVDTTESDDTRKVVTGASIEVELAQIYIDSLEINGEIDKDISSNWTSTGTYIQTTIYNVSDPEHSLLHRLLSNVAHWSFGEISESITEDGSDSATSTVHRTFNFTNTNVYDALQEIAKELDVVFTFDTANRKINMYDLNKIGKDTDIFVSTQNLATDFTCSTNKDNVKNCFKIVGGDEMINNAIRAVNPSGSDRIFYIPPEQMEGMSDGLKAKLQTYEALCERNGEEYTEACENLYNAIDKVYELETSMFPDRQPDVETTAEKEVAKLTASELGNIPVENIKTLYEAGAKKAVKTIAQLKVDYRYEVSIESSSYNSSSHTWSGKFKVENPTDGTAAISANDVTVTFVEDEKSSMQSKIDELLKDVDVSDDTDIETFRENLKNYSKDYLSDYEAIYKECVDILREKGYANKSDPKNNFYEFYHSYWEKWNACVDELRTRKMEISKAQVEQHKCEKKVKTFQQIMDFSSNLGDYYKEFCLYKREDVYQNDNYISDGMNSSELLRNAKKLIEAATKELYKASILQTVYTANLNNLFTNPIYKPFYNNFELFNWIHADIDNKQVMLRLIGITYDFSAMEKIEVEFSEQVRNANGMTDIESILNQSKSMATSYSSTVKQAATGSSVGLEFSNMKKQGLNSSLMNIKSANEEVTIDSKGINCKSMDQNGDYDSHQLQITGKNMVLTDDDWETARMAIGDMVVEYDSDGDGVAEQHEIYGLIADYIQGDIVLSTDVRVLNKNSSITMDENGLLILNRENNIYVKIDTGSDNIIEIGKDASETIRVTQNWKRLDTGRNFANDDFRKGFDSTAGGTAGTVTAVTSNLNDFTKLVSQNQTICIDGVNYLVFLSKLKKYVNGTWVTLGDFESISGLSNRDNNRCYGNNFIVKRKENDGYIYIVCYSHGNYRNTHGCIIRYDIKNNSFENVNTYSMPSISYAGASSYVMQDNIIYKAEDTMSTTSISGSSSHKIILDYTGEEITPVSWNNGNKQIRECFVYNNEFYAIIGYKKTNSLVKIDDIETISYTTSISLQGTSANTFNEEYVYFVPILNGNYVYIYFLNDFSSMNYAQNSKISCRIVNLVNNTYIDEECELYLDTRPCSGYTSTNTRNYRRGVFGISENGEIHLFNGAKKASYAWGTRYGSGGAYGWSWNKRPTYIACSEHYVYNPSKKYELSGMIEEKQTGTNFLSSQQKCFGQIGDVVYCINSNYTFDDSSSSRYDDETYSIPLNNYIKKLDLSSSGEANWQLIGTVSTVATDSGYHVKFSDIIQSNSDTYIYIHYCYVNRDNCYNGIAKFDTVTNTFTYNGNEDYAITGNALCIGEYGFAYYDEENDIMYAYCRNGLYKITNNFKNSTVIYNSSFTSVSNIIWKSNKCYFVASYGNTYNLYSLTYDGTLKELYKIDGLSYSSDIGFSIGNRKSIISIVYAENGVLKSTFHVYHINENIGIKYTGMFQDTGLYTVENSYETNSTSNLVTYDLEYHGAFKTCFVPQIGTKNGIHFFIGKPQFEDKTANLNGGYKHYVMTLVDNGETITDPKVFYVTKDGEGYFNGTVYAKSGRFEGEIVAKSLTLAPEVNIPEDNISAFGIIREDINGINEDINGINDGIIDINGNITNIKAFNKALDEKVEKNFKDIVEGNVDLAKVIYKGDITTTAEKIGENTKYTTKIPIGDGNYIENITYDNDDYILTNVGIGAYTDPSGETVQPYVMISKEGLLKANNAVIQGTVYATDGRFKGDIIANSLTLGTGVKIESANVSGLDDLVTSVTNIEDGKTKITNVIYNDDITTTKEKISDNPEVYKVTTTIPGANGTSQSVVTYEGGDYILTNVGYGDKSDTYTMISKDGLLTCNNAVINGTVYASAGQIAGFLISDQGQHRGNALESSHYSEANGYGTYLQASTGDIWNYSTSGKSWFALRGGYLNMASYDPSTQTIGYLGSNYTILGNDGLHVTDVTSYDSTTNIYKRGLNTQVRSSGLIIENHIGSTDVESTNVKKNGLFISDTLNYRIVQVTGKGLVVDCDDLDTGIHNTTEVRQDRVTTNGVALTSDRKAKENIAEIDDEISKQLILGLEPVTFNYKSSTRNRTHMGFIAQDVSSLCEELDMPDMSLYEARIKSEEGMSKDYVEGTDESELNWYLNYTELIAPLIKTVQLQDEEIQLQNKEIEKQASEIAELKERLAKLEAILLQ